MEKKHNSKNNKKHNKVINKIFPKIYKYNGQTCRSNSLTLHQILMVSIKKSHLKSLIKTS